jgi:hypothetical protein
MMGLEKIPMMIASSLFLEGAQDSPRPAFAHQSEADHPLKVSEPEQFGREQRSRKRMTGTVYPVPTR